ncbi:MAG: hypothetical protein Q8Q29_03650 [Actinomycetota bacterium]|nr:hypothetical protein [Actinomycetota bacterium]
MVTITIDEITLNATRAALDERVERLNHEVGRLQSEVARGDACLFREYELTEDAQRALVWNIAALHETRMAQEFYAEVEPGADFPADMTLDQMSWTSA